MQYRVPRHPFVALFLSSLLLAAAASLIALMTFGSPLFLSIGGATLFLLLAALLARRYLFSGMLYRLSEDYAYGGLDFYRLDSRGSHHQGHLPFEGNETLIPFDKQGRRACKARKKGGNMLANLFPRDVYALLYTDDEGTPRYVLLEAEPFFARMLENEIARAARLYPDGNGR